LGALMAWWAGRAAEMPEGARLYLIQSSPLPIDWRLAQFGVGDRMINSCEGFAPVSECAGGVSAYLEPTTVGSRGAAHGR